MKKRIMFGVVLLPALTWAQDNPRPALQDTDTKSMFPAMCAAGTRIQDKTALGGFGVSNNLPKPVGAMKVQNNKVYLQANPDLPTTFAQKYRGMTLLLVNTTNSSKPFEASDSRLSIVQEALDKQGRWRPIEFFYSSFCGNSHHKVFLGPKEYWSFAVPRYKGTFKTKLRFRLSQEKTNLLSNEFEGSINPGQFTAPKEPRKFVLPPL